MSVLGSGSEPGSSGPPTPHPADGTPPDLQDDPSFQADLLAHVTDAVIAIDGQNRIVYWNQAAERTYGWAADEVLGGDARTLLHPDLTIEEPESRARAIRETGRWHGEIVHHRKDGSLVDVEAYTILHGLLDGSALISINRDITSLKRTDRERERNLRRLEGLHQIAIAILESKTTEELARLALSRLSELVPATRLSLSRFEPATEELVVLQVLSAVATQVGVGARFPLAATGSAAGLLRGELNLVPTPWRSRIPLPRSSA